MSLMKLEVVTPTGAVISEEVTSVVAPGATGELGILFDHRPGLIMLGGGSLTYQGPKGAGEILLRGGVAEVGPEKVLILADEAFVKSGDSLESAKTIASSLLDDAKKALLEAGFISDEEFEKMESDTRFAEAVLG
ncbi:MAG: ATP synthase F1 subunit epsilon [Bradymonadia bacterium]